MKQKIKTWQPETFNFFSELSIEQINFINKNSELKAVNKNEIIYFQEENNKGVYFLNEGKIKLSKFSSKGAEFIISILGPGEIFGDALLLTGSSKKEVATAEENSILSIMTKDKMKELLFMSPKLNLKYIRELENRLEKTQIRLEELTFKTNEERIISFLKESALNSSEKTGEQIIIKNILTHESIAKLTSTNRQIVSTVLSELRKKQIIDYNRKELRILEYDRLEALI